MLKATWMPAIDQSLWAFAIGLTKSVQPYCRLAIRIMQMTPMMSCVHRLTDGPPAIVDADIDVSSSPMRQGPVLLVLGPSGDGPCGPLPASGCDAGDCLCPCE